MDVLSLDDVSKRLSCSTEMLEKWLRRGDIPTVKIGRLTRIRSSDVDAWCRLGLKRKGGYAQ